MIHIDITHEERTTGELAPEKVAAAVNAIETDAAIINSR